MSHQVKLIFGVSNGPERMNNLCLWLSIQNQYQWISRYRDDNIRSDMKPNIWDPTSMQIKFLFYDSFVRLCTEKKIRATCSSQTRIIPNTQIENMLMKSCMYEVTFLLWSDSTQSLQQLNVQWNNVSDISFPAQREHLIIVTSVEGQKMPRLVVNNQFYCHH